MPDTTIQVIGKEVAPVRDVQGLRLFPDVSIADAGLFDVLLVPGGHGQQALMHDEEVLELIRTHVQRKKLLFSVCTGALLCGAAGALMGRQVTTHWITRHLMRYYGAVLVDARVVVDGNFISAAGVTAGLDAALALVSLLRGMRQLRRSSLPLSMRRTPSSTAELPRVHRLMCLRAFRRSTSQSELRGRKRQFDLRQTTTVRIRADQHSPSLGNRSLQLHEGPEGPRSRYCAFTKFVSTTSKALDPEHSNVPLQ